MIVVVIPITANHLVQQPVLSEAVDGVVSALAFAVAFGGGVLLGRVRPGDPARRHLLRGASFGAIWTLTIILFWNVVPDSFRAVHGVVAWVGHMLWAALLGWGSARLSRWRLATGNS